ncbi:hypothetical protein FPV67DRAFT_450398 [Lyophyllum atratum]|nr:hypothetical protein FPV67DRAFT_450398 [Lyophyllum atratum]
MHARLTNVPFEDLDDLSSVLTLGIQAAVLHHETTLNQRAFDIFKEERRKVSHWGKYAADLSHLLEKPREIFYEVLGHLHPIDLFHLLRVCKQFRGLLISRNSAWLWDLVFERHSPAIPFPPAGIMQPKWADLLFASSGCDDCDYIGDWHYISWKRRCCYHCWSPRINNFVQELYPFNIQLDFDAELNEQSIADRVLNYQFLTYRSWYEDRATTRLNDLKKNESTKVFVASIIAQQQILEEWVEWRAERTQQEYIKRRHYFEQQHERIMAILLSRLMPLGHEECDIRELFERYTASFILAPAKVTLKKPIPHIRSNWPTIKARLEPMIFAIATPRLQKVREILISSRQTAILRVLEDRQTLISDDELWSHLPSLHDFLSYEPFHSLAHLPPDVELDPASISNEIIPFIKRWPPKTMADLAAICIANFPIPICHSSRPGEYDLEGASSVFTCVACKEEGSSLPGWSIIGWSALDAHRSCNHLRLYHPFEISERGCSAATTLMDLLDLDPQTTTPLQLDDRGGIFACLNCPERNGCRAIHTWRGCVSHYMEMDRGTTHLSPTWKIMSQEDVLTGNALEAMEAVRETETLAYAGTFLFNS